MKLKLQFFVLAELNLLYFSVPAAEPIGANSDS